MARTFNRVPYTVNTPSKSDVKNYFFTHANWKGLNNDKNFLTVDQETFSECNNVYMDTEGLLRSRPCLKIKTVKLTIDGEEIVLSDVYDVYQFEKITVYKVLLDGDYYLIFVSENGNCRQVSCDEKVALYLAEGKIFVFEQDDFNYYDVETGTYMNADNFIYIPVTKTFKDGYWNDLESPNELTDSYAKRYLIDDEYTDADFDLLVNKDVRLTINGNTYLITFKKDNQLVFFEATRNLSDDNFITISGLKYPLVSVSETESYLLSYTTYDTLKLYNKYSIYYTSDGIIFEGLPEIKDVIGFPKISKDGNYAVCLKSDDLYVISLANTNDNNVFDNWTPLIKNKHTSFYYEDFNELLEEYTFGEDAIPEMYTIDNFAIYLSKDTGNSFRDRVLISCYDGNCSINFFSKNIYFASNSVNLFTFRTSNEEDFVEFSDKEFVFSTGNFTNNLCFKFKGISVDKTRGLSTATYYVSGIIEIGIKDAQSNYCKKYTDEFGLTFDGDGDYNGKYHYIDRDFSIFNIRYLMKIIINGTIIDITFDVNSIVSQGALDIQYMGEGYYLDNLYSYTPNMAYTINADTCKYLILTQNAYTLDVKQNTVYTIRERTIYNRSTIFDAIYIANDYCMYCRYFYPNLRVNKYDIEHTWLDITEYNYIKSIFNSDGQLLTNTALYTDLDFSNRSSNKISLLFQVTPISWQTNIYACDYSNLYSNKIKDILIDEVVRGSTNYILPDFISELSSIYIAEGKTLYISTYPKDGNFKWYLPKISTEVFDSEINNIHPISSTEMAVFLKDSVYHIQRQNDSDSDGYDEHFYIKSKLQVGCKNGSGVITSFDGKYVIFPSNRGLVAITYQELTASTEQVLTFLSDSISTTFSNYNTSSIKLYKYKYWILCYKNGSNEMLCFDIRNNSWWPLQVPYNITKIITCNDEPLFLCNNSLFVPYYGDDNYYDYDGETSSQIEWLFKSQKLHLSAPNYYKHISNITLTSVLEENELEPLDLNLTVTNYRKRANTSDVENFMFNVDTIRVYVKRLNYSKVNEFQYTLQSNEDNAIKIPLSLSSVCVKYKISSEVR